MMVIACRSERGMSFYSALHSIELTPIALAKAGRQRVYSEPLGRHAKLRAAASGRALERCPFDSIFTKLTLLRILIDHHASMPIHPIIMTRTTQYVLLASVVYASVPVALSMGSAGLAQTLTFQLPILLTATALPMLFNKKMRHTIGRTLKAPAFVRLAVLQASMYIMCLYFFVLAVSEASIPQVLILAETWPIITALLIAPLIGKKIKRLTGAELFWGVVAFLGVLVTINFPVEFNKIVESDAGTPIIFALLSSFLMGVASALKAKAVDILKTEYEVGPVGSYFILQLFFLPCMIFLSLFISTDYSLLFNDDLNGKIILYVTIASVVSAILFSAATLRMTRASEAFVWFFTPVFSIVYFVLIFQQSIASNELIGLFLILSANILISLNSNKTLAPID